MRSLKPFLTQAPVLATYHLELETNHLELETDYLELETDCLELETDYLELERLLEIREITWN